MKYCINTTNEHPLSIHFKAWVRKIKDIINEDLKPENAHKVENSFNDEVAISLDKLKENADNKDIRRMKSVDMVLGIKNSDDKKMLLVELKLNCNGIKKFSEGDCSDKVKDSKIMLFGGGVPIYNKSYFIFNDEFLLKEEARFQVVRKINNPDIIVQNICEFKEMYFN